MSIYARAILVRMARSENGCVNMATVFNIAELVQLGYAVPIPGLKTVYGITPAGRDYYQTEMAS